MNRTSNLDVIKVQTSVLHLKRPGKGGLKSRTDESRIIVIPMVRARAGEMPPGNRVCNVRYATLDKRCQIDELEIGTVGLGLPSSRRSG